MQSNILSLLQSPDLANQQLGFTLYKSMGCEQVDKWFDGLNILYRHINNKDGNHDSLLVLYQCSHLYLKSEVNSELPDEIGLLTNLEDLDLGHHSASKLPESIGNLNKLISLDLDHNHLQVLPDSFKNLTELEFLYLRGNKLKTIPTYFQNFTKLKDLWLHNNPIPYHEIEQLREKLPNTSIKAFSL